MAERVITIQPSRQRVIELKQVPVMSLWGATRPKQPRKKRATGGSGAKRVRGGRTGRGKTDKPVDAEPALAIKDEPCDAAGDGIAASVDPLNVDGVKFLGHSYSRGPLPPSRNGDPRHTRTPKGVVQRLLFFFLFKRWFPGVLLYSWELHV